MFGFIEKIRELKSIDQKINEKRSELESLKEETERLQSFLISKFQEEFKEFDYEVDITDCYVIELNGKKHIALKQFETKIAWYCNMGGRNLHDISSYYDVLDMENGNFKKIYEWKYAHWDYEDYSSGPWYEGVIPEYEEHILTVFPELKFFKNNKVPNTYLQKMAYELNNSESRKINQKN